MELHEFDYENKPYMNKKYEILPLSSNGFHQYIGNESYIHKFLIKQPPKNVTDKEKFCITNKEKIEKDEDNLHQKENNDEINGKDDYFIDNDKYIENKDINCDSDNLDKSKIDSLKNYNENKEKLFEILSKKNVNVESDYKSKNHEFKKNRLLKSKSGNFFDDIMMSNKKNNHNSNLSSSTNNKLLTKSSKRSSNNFSISTEKSFYFQKSNLDPLSRRLNYTSSNFHKTNDSKIIGGTRYDKNYLKNLDLFIKSKSYFNMDKIIETDSMNCKTKYDGFKSFNVPHFQNLKLEKNKSPVYHMTQKMAKSCIGNGKSYNENLSDSDLYLKEAQEENEKLKKIILFQTSTDFLKKSKLPEIYNVIDQPRLKINSNKNVIARVKHMGGNYNPYNFQAGRDCESKRRNQVGALFQH